MSRTWVRRIIASYKASNAATIFSVSSPLLRPDAAASWSHIDVEGAPVSFDIRSEARHVGTESNRSRATASAVRSSSLQNKYYY